MREHVQVVMGKLVTEDICPVLSTQDTDPYRRRGDNLTVKLLVLLQTLSIRFRRNKDPPLIHSRQHKQRDAYRDVQQNGVKDQDANALQHLVHRQRIDNAQRRWR